MTDLQSHEVFVVKIQLPLFSRENYTLVYNEDHSVLQQFPTTPEIIERMDGEVKRYMWAYVDEDGILQLFQDAPEQDW